MDSGCLFPVPLPVSLHNQTLPFTRQEKNHDVNKASLVPSSAQESAAPPAAGCASSLRSLGAVG